VTKRIAIRRRDGSVAAWTVVDDEDYDLLAGYRWSMHPRGYAQTGGGDHKELMHRMLLGLTPNRGGGRGSGARSLQADHINGDKLDNRRANLRIVTNQENHQNRRGANRGSSSRYRGVYLHKATGKWMARVRTGGKDYYFGSFSDELQAAAAAAAGRRQLFPMATD
jgi:hypothetical protein